MAQRRMPPCPRPPTDTHAAGYCRPSGLGVPLRRPDGALLRKQRTSRASSRLVSLSPGGACCGAALRRGECMCAAREVCGHALRSTQMDLTGDTTDSMRVTCWLVGRQVSRSRAICISFTILSKSSRIRSSPLATSSWCARAPLPSARISRLKIRCLLA